MLKFLESFWDKIVWIGLPLVYFYHICTGNVFLNTAVENATGLEEIGNALLAPTQYLMVGRIAYDKKKSHGIQPEAPPYKMRQRFDYQDNYFLRTFHSFRAFPFSIITGCLFKGLSYIFPDARMHHQAIIVSRKSTHIDPNEEYYQMIGLNVGDIEKAEKFTNLGYKRRPGDENHLSSSKEAIRAIFEIFNAKNIPCWVDCGTCFGTYRYGGVIPWDMDVDVAILASDFENAWHALQLLDPEKYAVQDWSSRDKPYTYLKVYVKEARELIDIYHYVIYPKDKKLKYFLSNEDCVFLAEWWKIRERRFTVPFEYDDIFPLKKAIFDGVEVFVPNKTEKFLQSFYGEDLRPAKIYDPITDAYEKDLNHPYWKRAYVH